MSATGYIDFTNIRKVLKDVEQKRQHIADYHTAFSRLARVLGKVGEVVDSTVAGVTYEIASMASTSGKDKLDIVMTGKTSFMCACKEIVGKLEHLIDFYKKNPNVLSKQDFEPTKFQYSKREVIISIYGDSNAGKSTLLNCILGNMYLPIKQQSETAVTVHIQFLDPQEGKSNPNDPSSEDIHEVLCVWNEKEKETIVAKGQKDIHKKLLKINKDKREVKKHGMSVTSTYTLKLKHPFGIARNEDRKFILFDNPGCDEYGSETISTSIEMAKAVSSAFIFVTTIDGYTKLGSSGTLQTLYAKNPEILKQHRLTIIVNKMDSALQDKFGEDSSSREDVVLHIRSFFCKTVFKINEKDLPQDSIILVCGQWALLGRSYKNTPSKDTETYLMPQIVSMRSISEFKDLKELQEVKDEAHFEQASLLEKHSNITLLEERLKMMSRKSTLFWKQKIMQDLKDNLKKLEEQLTSLVAVEQHDITELKKEIKLLFQAMQRLDNCYSEIMENENLCKKKKLPHNNEVLVKLREAYEKDMQGKQNMQTQLKEYVDLKLQDFEISTKKKIKARTHTSTMLRADLKQLIEDIAGSINHYSKSHLENVTVTFQDMNESIKNKTGVLRGTFSSLLNPNKLFEEDHHKSATCSAGLPKLTGLVSEFSLRIPLQLSSWQQFVKFLKTIFWRPLDEYSQPVFQNSYTDEDESLIEAYYTKWSDELEAMKDSLKEEFYKDIARFFENAEENVIQKCCEQHYEFCLLILKDFNETAADNINACKHKLEQKMTDAEKKMTLCETMKFHCKKVKYMKDTFEYISQQEKL